MSTAAALVPWVPLADWGVAFALTQAVEAPLYRWAAGARWRVALGASALTHPLVWFAFPALLEEALGWVPMVLAAEAFAIGAEALWLRRFHVARPLPWSALANGASVGVGLVMM